MKIIQTDYLIFLVNRIKQRIKRFENFARNLKKNTHITKLFFSKSTFSATICLSISYNESIMTELYE